LKFILRNHTISKVQKTFKCSATQKRLGIAVLNHHNILFQTLITFVDEIQCNASTSTCSSPRLFSASLLLSKLLLKYRRRTMYFISCFMTIASLLAFATFNYLLLEVGGLSKPVSTRFKWSSLAAAGMLVFAVQLGVQTLPMLLSGF